MDTEVDEIKEQMGKLTLDTNEKYLQDNINQFETYLKQQLENNFTFNKELKGKAIGADAERLIREKLVDFMNEKLQLQINYNDPIVNQRKKGDKELEDFRYKNIFFDSKVKGVDKFDINKLSEEKDIFIQAYKIKDKIKEKLDEYDISYKKSDKLDILAKKFRKGLKTKELEIEEDKAIEIIKEQTGGDAQLISYKKLLKEVLDKKQPLYYVIIYYQKKSKKILHIYILDLYKIDFSKLKIYLGNQFYFSGKLFYKFKRDNKTYDIEETKKSVRDRIIATRKELIDNYIKEIEDLTGLLYVYTEQQVEEYVEEQTQEQNLELETLKSSYNLLKNNYKKLLKKQKQFEEQNDYLIALVNRFEIQSGMKLFEYLN